MYSEKAAMDATVTTARPSTLFGIALTTIAAGGMIGALTNAINGAVSPTYFMNILQWRFVTDVWRAAVAQGILEGLIYGTIFAIVFTLVIGLVSKAHVTFAFAIKHLVTAAGVALASWCIGGLLAMGLAIFSPDFYRSTFIGVPEDLSSMLRYAWVGGSIWGVLFGAVLSIVIASVMASADWRRNKQASA
jgi:hypothetical protein